MKIEKKKALFIVSSITVFCVIILSLFWLFKNQKVSDLEKVLSKEDIEVNGVVEEENISPDEEGTGKPLEQNDSTIEEEEQDIKLYNDGNKNYEYVPQEIQTLTQPEPKEEVIKEKCPSETISLYEARLASQKQSLQDAIHYAQNTLEQDIGFCEYDYNSCHNDAVREVDTFLKERPSCWRSGACMAEKERLEEDLFFACEREETQCKNTATTKLNNNAMVIRYEGYIAETEQLLASCR